MRYRSKQARLLLRIPRLIAGYPQGKRRDVVGKKVAVELGPTGQLARIAKLTEATVHLVFPDGQTSLFRAIPAVREGNTVEVEGTSETLSSGRTSSAAWADRRVED